MSETFNLLEVGAPMPKSIGLCADEYHRVRTLRLAMQKETESVEAREKEIKEYIINSLSKSDDTGAAGLLYRAQIVMKTKPQIADWASFTAAVRTENRFDLIQKRVSDKAIEEIWDAGFEVPGIAKIHVPDVSITKIK